MAIGLDTEFPGIFIWHCMSKGAAVLKDACLNQFQSFFDKLYSLCHTSAKNHRELTTCCETLSCIVKT